jgi:RNase P/RNase MRP subunit p29
MKTKNYAITRENILCHEMIGLGVNVIASTDKGRVGIKGIVVDETQFTFVIDGTHGKTKGEFVVPKKECEFEFLIGKEKAVVKGNDVLKRPEDRVKEWRK